MEQDVRDLRIRTYEELVWDKIVKMSTAKETGNEYLFDELLDEIEMLFKLMPEIYAAFKPEKDELDKALQNNLKQAKNYTATIVDEITKEVITKQKQAVLAWEYRSDMLEMIFNLVNSFQMIPFTNPELSELASIEQAEFEPDETSTEIPTEIETDEPTPPNEIPVQQAQNPKIRKPQPDAPNE